MSSLSSYFAALRFGAMHALRWSPLLFLPAALAVGFVLAALAGATPGAAKDSWYENPLDRKTPSGRSGRRGGSDKTAAGEIARQTFEDPPHAGRIIFGADAERSLIAAIRRYEAIVAAGGWPAIPKGEPLATGITGERVYLLNRRLIASGDLRQTGLKSYKYNEEEVEAVTKFQLRHGLRPTGRVYRRTLEALNVPAKLRLAQLRANLQRIREVAKQVKARRYVMINIPAYELQAVSGGRVELFSRVITGKPSTPSPIMRTAVRAVNFYPYWNVPVSIARAALIPKAAKDPGYLARERIRVFAGQGREVDPSTVNWSSAQARRYTFRQDPGPQNALGLLRFDMPNKHTVYMHDTPMQRLFRYGVRSYSAGCVRVNKVVDLTQWMLGETGSWSRADVQRALAAAKGDTVDLVRPVPVHLVYVTAWGAPDGTAQFRLDVYNRDDSGRVVADLEGPKAQISALTP